MAGLYNRMAARGFPTSVAAGQTGVASLADQGGTVNPAHGQDVPAVNVSTIPGFPADTVAPITTVLLEGTWGLSGGVDLDRTPETHAAPVPGWAGSYAPSDDLVTMHENSARIHAADFGDLAPRIEGHMVEGTWDIVSSNNPGESVQQPIRGQLQAMGLSDDVQGYGLRNGYGFDAGHRTRIMNTTPQPMAFLDPAERLFIVPQASGSFTPTDDRVGPGDWWSGWDGTSVNATDPQPYTPPIEPSTNTSPLVGAPASSGWF